MIQKFTMPSAHRIEIQTLYCTAPYNVKVHGSNFIKIHADLHYTEKDPIHIQRHCTTLHRAMQQKIKKKSHKTDVDQLPSSSD